jgi:hypothetical protein
MNLFYQAFNSVTLTAIGVELEPHEQCELIENLADTLRLRLRRIVEERLGRTIDQIIGMDEETVRDYFPDHQDILLTEVMRLFQEVEEHAAEIMGDGWEVAA